MSRPHSASDYPWSSGALYIGQDDVGNDVGVHTERHAITIAGARSGKGVGIIIPNLLRWPHNALVIDPKGEAASATIKEREAMGIPSFVFDPFQTAQVPDHLRVTINPLDKLDPESFTISEDINAIADGLVMRPDPQAAHWDDGAAKLLAGLIAWVLLHYPHEERNLITVRKIQLNGDLFAETVDAMRTETRCGGLCQAGAGAAYAKEGGYYVSNAEKNTGWLDSQAMHKALAQSTFDMDTLKWGKASLFLVLPAKYLKQHGRFLRLFVRTAIETMQQEKSGQIKGSECLFLLDEFFALGYLDEVVTSAGLMPGYGLKLWPILQDLDQLNKLYGQDGASTFFGSADLHTFFGNMDTPTLRYISERIGNYSVSDLPPEPRMDTREVDAMYDEVIKDKNRLFGGSPARRLGILEARKIKVKYLQERYNNDLAKFRQDASRILGKPRMPPDDVAKFIAKPPKGPCEKIIAFVHGGTMISVRLAPYYLNQ